MRTSHRPRARRRRARARQLRPTTAFDVGAPHEGEAEASRKVEIELYGREPLLSALRILYLEIDLRFVEGGLALGLCVAEPEIVHCRTQHHLALCPKTEA